MVVALSTDDGGAVPPGTLVCLDTICQRGGEVQLAATLGQGYTFVVAPGAYTLSVRDATPYADIARPVTVIAGESQVVSLALTRSQPATPTPTASVQPSPLPTKPADPPRVEALPNTGALGDLGRDSGATIAFAVLLAGIVLGSALFVKRRIE